jgi:hypothetical protein
MKIKVQKKYGHYNNEMTALKWFMVQIFGTPLSVLRNELMDYKGKIQENECK